MTYGITVWGTASEIYLKLVQITQKNVVRAMTFSNLTAHSLPLFSNLKILKVDDLYTLSISSFVYECHNNLTPTHFTDYFTQISAIHSYNTRGPARGDHFIVRKNTLVYRIRSICFKVVDSCWISSTEVFFVYGKKQESRKKYIITVQKNFTFLWRFDRKNTVLGISRNLIDKFVFKCL